MWWISEGQHFEWNLSYPWVLETWKYIAERENLQCESEFYRAEDRADNEIIVLHIAQDVRLHSAVFEVDTELNIYFNMRTYSVVL